MKCTGTPSLTPNSNQEHVHKDSGTLPGNDFYNTCLRDTIPTLGKGQDPEIKLPIISSPRYLFIQSVDALQLVLVNIQHHKAKH